MVDSVLLLVSAACYPERIAPAADRFSRTGDVAPIAAMLREAQQRNPAAKDPFDPYPDLLDVVERREFYRPSTNHVPPRAGARTSKADMKKFVTGQVMPRLFKGLCLADGSGVPAEQTLTRGGLLPYLYQKSEYLERMFTGGLTGKAFAGYPGAEILAIEDLKKILSELERIPPPGDAAERRQREEQQKAMEQSGRKVFVSSEFASMVGPLASVAMDDLKRLLRLATTRPGLAVLLVYE